LAEGVVFVIQEALYVFEAEDGRINLIDQPNTGERERAPAAIHSPPAPRFRKILAWKTSPQDVDLTVVGDAVHLEDIAQVGSLGMAELQEGRRECSGIREEHSFLVESQAFPSQGDGFNTAAKGRESG